jgi:NAD(P)-dependent dehydrogenase (short-subunit alcohol dehydrogenase family)
MSDSEFTGRVAVVTGASSGIGRRTAERLADSGAFVVAFARDSEALRSVGLSNPSHIETAAGDVADEGDVGRLFELTETRFGDCDLLINCAGSIVPKLLHEMTAAEWDRHFDVNVRGTFLTSRRAVPSMIARRSGSIINIASISGVEGPQKFPGFSAYCASKAAVISLTEVLAVELKAYGIRVNCISPGSVDTPMLRRAHESLTPDMTPDEIVNAILFVASAASRPMNGQNLHVYGP